MRSDRWRELSRTFRFRLAMYHVLLVSAALTATFIIALSVTRSFSSAASRRQMDSALRQAQRAYLGGHLAEEPRQLPEDILMRIEEEFPTLRIGQVEREAQPDGFMYEVIGSTGGEWLELLAEPGGRMWIADRKPLEEVFGLMVHAVAGAGPSDIELLVYSPAGLLLAATPSAKLPPETLERFMRGPGVLEQLTILRSGSAWVGGTVLYDGNLLLAVSQMDELLRIARWEIIFFVLLMSLFIPLSGWIGFFLSRKAMAGVKRLAAAADAVRIGNFEQRVPAGSEGAEIEELAGAFNDMVARIEVLVRELRDVAVHIAHDLRTPLARIRGMLESLDWQETPLAEREQTVLAAIEECDRIAPLIDAVLELAKAETGMLAMRKDQFDLAREIRSAHALFSSVAEDRRIAFACAVPAEAVVAMSGDRARVQRVIANLIDNALKFTPEGGEVVLTLERDGPRAVFAIRDTGPGIPPADLPRVFERFYRGDSSRTTAGYGLGLSMVNAFVKSMGGTVEIESGNGCSVTVVLPLEAI